MITKISIVNFRQIRKLEIDPFPGITLFTGLNGTGKSTVIVALSRLLQFMQGEIALSELWGEEDIPIWDYNDYGRVSCCFEFCAKIPEKEFSYKIAIGRSLHDDNIRIESESLHADGVPLYHSVTGDALVWTNDSRIFEFPVDWSSSSLGIAQRYNYIIREFIDDIVDKMFFIAPNPYTIEGSHTQPDKTLKLSCNNFSAWYDYWLLLAPDKLSHIFNQVKEFFPGFIRFSLPPHGIGKQLVAQIDKIHRPIPFSAFSDGQKTLSILYSLISVVPNGSTIAIDEFENFLSPLELQPLYSMMNEAWENREIQFLLVSHSPSTIDWFRDSALKFIYDGEQCSVQKFKFDPNIHINLNDALQN